MSNSDSAIKFEFNKSNGNNKEQINSNTSDVNEDIKINETTDVEEDLNDNYIDRRKVTINLIKNHSLYRKANDKVLPKRKDFIGSSINSSMILASNKEEIEAYFPNIVGVSPSDPSFMKRVKNYLNNIRIPVDELGRSFDISFHYNTKKEYLKIRANEDRIEEEYNKANKQTIKLLKEALKIKITKLNELESSKHKHGRPINVEDYLMYRHCLLYKDIAKDIALVNSDTSIRFYFKDEQKEAEKLRKFRMEIVKAKSNYLKCIADPKLFEAVYIQYCITNNLPIMPSLAEDNMTKELKLDKFSEEDPVKFNKICNNKNIKLMANIEKLIARGELIRSQYNQNITTEDGTFIGSNINEAVVWFNDPNNISVVNAYINKLNNN